MRVWLAAAVLAFLVAGLVGSALMVEGLEGPQLYVYSDQGVYPPGSLAVFRVLAIGADGGPAAGVNIVATVYDPVSAEVGQFEGVTDGGGWFVLSVVLETEGFYTVSVQDVGGEYVGSEVSVLVCSSCPPGIPTTTVTSTTTVTTSVGTVTSTTTTTVTTSVGTVTSTIIPPATTTVYTTVVSSYGTTVYEATAFYGTLTTTVVSISTVRSVELVERIRTATLLRTGTVTVYGTVSLTETVKEYFVSTFFTTVGGVSDGGLMVAVIIAVALVLSTVLFYVRRKST